MDPHETTQLKHCGAENTGVSREEVLQGSRRIFARGRIHRFRCANLLWQAEHRVRRDVMLGVLDLVG